MEAKYGRDLAEPSAQRLKLWLAFPGTCGRVGAQPGVIIFSLTEVFLRLAEDEAGDQRDFAADLSFFFPRGSPLVG